MKENRKGGGSFKNAWQAPATEIQTFTPNEYVAACASPYWLATCEKTGYVYADQNGDGQYTYNDDMVKGSVLGVVTTHYEYTFPQSIECGQVRLSSDPRTGTVQFIFSASDTTVPIGFLESQRYVKEGATPIASGYVVTDVNGSKHFVTASSVVQKNPS